VDRPFRPISGMRSERLNFDGTFPMMFTVVQPSCEFSRKAPGEVLCHVGLGGRESAVSLASCCQEVDAPQKFAYVVSGDVVFIDCKRTSIPNMFDI
jgi:hypothetical protein